MSAVEAIWWGQPGPLARLLLAPLRLAALLFGAVVALRGWLHDRGLIRATRAAAPVISIGNLAVGGAGKTPAAVAVATRLVARGRRVAILSHGYGASRPDPRIVSDGAEVRLGAAEGGDEPVLLARRLPGVSVLCGPRRAVLAGMATGALAADALVLDDGFQHRALARDLDVVVIDAASPFGNGRLLPAGPNREPRSALRRAGLVWLSRVDQADAATLERLRALALAATGRPPVESRHRPVDVLDGRLARGFGLDALRGVRVALVSGIARPLAFRRTVEALGAAVVAEHRFPDHHRFGDGELAGILAAVGGAGPGLVVTTEKDAVRLAPAEAAHPALRVVRVDAELVRGGDVLDAALDGALAAAAARLGQPPSQSPTAARPATATS
jgi:tetraacyldisaccharide 4'-kinase